MAKFKDLFSQNASEYSKFRPSYPKELFSYLAELSIEKNLAWDVGTGNGQAAIALVPHFSKILATDPSEKQISQATPQERISYMVSSAEQSPIEENTVDLITVAQAFHWFKHEEFYREIIRVAKSGAVLAIWSYAIAIIEPHFDRMVHHLHFKTLDPFWEPERKLVIEGYKNVKVPFRELEAPHFQMKETWSFDRWIGYLNTWSSVQKMIRETGKNPVDLIKPELEQAWGAVKEREIRWPLSIRIFRI